MPWETYTDDDGYEYYYDPDTGVSTYERPDGGVAGPAEADMVANPPVGFLQSSVSD